MCALLCTILEKLLPHGLLPWTCGVRQPLLRDLCNDLAHSADRPWATPLVALAYSPCGTLHATICHSALQLRCTQDPSNSHAHSTRFGDMLQLHSGYALLFFHRSAAKNASSMICFLSIGTPIACPSP